VREDYGKTGIHHCITSNEACNKSFYDIATNSLAVLRMEKKISNEDISALW
jgi:hypothetical protein